MSTVTTTGTCLCGCGTPTKGTWAIGHDARALERVIADYYGSHADYLMAHNGTGAANTVAVKEYGSVAGCVRAHRANGPRRATAVATLPPVPACPDCGLQHPGMC